MKHFAFLKAREPSGRLHDEALRSYAAPPFAASLNLVQQTHGSISWWDIVIEAWTDEQALLDRLQTLLPHSSALAIYRVTETVEKDQGPGPGWPVEGVRLIVPWIGRGNVSPAELRRHWDEHVPLANRIHVGVTHYARNWVESAVGTGAAAAPNYRGIASQCYPSERDLRERSFDSPASVQVIIDDVADFIAQPVILQVVEYRASARPAPDVDRPDATSPATAQDADQ